MTLFHEFYKTYDHLQKDCIAELDFNDFSILFEVLLRVRLENIPGDIVDVGVFRGGSSIFEMAAMNVFGLTHKKLWLCDSFNGCPDPETTKYGKHPQEEYGTGDFRCSIKEVVRNMHIYAINHINKINYELVEGWVEDTLHPDVCKIKEIAMLRIDVDLYSSTYSTIEHLYDKIVPGGYIIEDDYRLIAAKQAVGDFLKSRNLDPVLHTTGKTGWETITRDINYNRCIFWQKSK